MREFNPGEHDILSFIHITDTHLLDHPNDTLKSVNTLDSFVATLDEATRRHTQADFILLTGDISQHGSLASYGLLAAALSDCALPIYAIPGNHDSPELLNRVMPSSPVKGLNTLELGETSLILLNSWADGRHSGIIDNEQLQALGTYLQNNISRHCIVAIHHPPVTVNSRWLDELGLHNSDELMKVLGKHKAQILLLCGHVHQELDQQFENVRVLATPSTCFQFTPRTEEAQVEKKPRPAYRHVQLDRDFRSSTTVHYIDWQAHQVPKKAAVHAF